MAQITQLFNLFLTICEKIQPAVLLALRIAIAKVFWDSGLVKIADMETTILLFENEYAVPLISPVFAAYSATFFELVCPVLIVFGLGARLAAVPLIAMTAVIEFTYLAHIQHAWWAIMLGVILVVGPGKWSVDHMIAKNLKHT